MSSGGTFALALGSARPVAVVRPEEAITRMGQFLRLSGSASYDSVITTPPTALTYTWSVVSRPETSVFEAVDLISLEDNNSEVAFLADVPGVYEIGLAVNNGALDSAVDSAVLSSQVTELAHGSGEVPSSDFLWGSISDFWSIVEDKESLGIIFSAVIQMVASQLIRLYQNDFSKSLLETPDYFQRRWIGYDPIMELDEEKQVIYTGGQMAGSLCGTGPIGFRGTADLAINGVVTITSGSVAPQAIEHTFVVLSGMNAGRYTITAIINTGASGGQGYVVSPVFPAAPEVGAAFRIEEEDDDTTNVFFVPMTEADLTTLVNPSTRLIVVEDRAYRILRSFTDNVSFDYAVSGVVVDSQVPPGQRMLSWRVPWTLAANTQNFESEGVLPGDLMELHIRSMAEDVDLMGTLGVQIVGVVGNRLGFVPTLEDITGVSAPEPSDSEIEALAVELGISTEVIGGTSEMDELLVALRSAAFQNQYAFQGMIYDTDIVVTEDKFYQLSAYRIFQMGSLLVDSELRSVPLLQRQIQDPTNTWTGNTHYYVERPDGENQTDGQTEPNTGEFRAGYLNALEKGFLPGDELVLLDGSDVGTYTFVRFYSDTWAQVYPNFSTFDTTVKYYVRRRNRNTYLRFDPATFSFASLPPERMWADVSYYAPDKVVEGHWGTRLDFDTTEFSSTITGSTYKDAVTALLYSAMVGPTPSNLRRGAQGILGLPMSQHRGKIIEIDEDYEKNHRTGDPYLARIVVQDVVEDIQWESLVDHPDDHLLDRTRVYYYPAERTGLEDFTGLSTNPETSLRYVVGGVVDRFALLSRGVEYSDYLSDPTFWKTHGTSTDLGYNWQVKKYHTFRIRVLHELLVDTGQLALIDDFLDRARPAYTNYYLEALVHLLDEIEVSDSLTMELTYLFADNPAFGLETAMAHGTPNGHGDIIFVFGKGGLATRVQQHGQDLEITGASTAETAEDLSNATVGDHLVIKNGASIGRYDITNLVLAMGIYTLTVTQMTAAWPEGTPDPTAWIADSGLTFIIQRELHNSISSGVGATVVGATVTPDLLVGTEIDLGAGNTFFSDGCYTNDFLVTNTAGVTQDYFRIYDLDEATNRVYIVGTTGVGPYDWDVYREAFLEDYEAEISSLFHSWVAFVAGTDMVKNIIRLNDTLGIYDAAGLLVSTHKIIQVVDSTNLFVVPAPAAALVVGTGKISRGYPYVGYAMLLRSCPAEEVTATLVASVDTVAGAPAAVGAGTFTSAGENFTTLNVLPGDQIEITTPGTNFGVHAIRSVAGAVVGVYSQTFPVLKLSYQIIRSVR